jgi:hypothetical protein
MLEKRTDITLELIGSRVNPSWIFIGTIALSLNEGLDPKVIFINGFIALLPASPKLFTPPLRIWRPVDPACKGKINIW